MGSIIIAMPNIQDARKLSEMLKRRGLQTTAICTTASAILSNVHQLDSGIVICTPRFKDMYCNEIAECLPGYFEMLLLSPRDGLEHCPPGVVTIGMPFKVSELLGTVDMLLIQLERRIKKDRQRPKKRSKEEQEAIDQAKKILMERNEMTEQEAFRYIQKCSMDSSTNMVETAQMILMMQVD